MAVYKYFFALLLLTALTCLGCSTVTPWTRHVRLECGSCHDGKPMKGSPALKNEKNPSETCKRCHNYLKDDDHHPSDPDFELIGEKCAVVDPIFPLVSGKMECLTCHQMHAEEASYSGTRHFLRGGPYSDRRTVCFKCHKEEVFKNFNPHNEMVVENGLNYSTCLTCHRYPPDPNTDFFKTVKFRASVPFLCWRCHPPMAANFLDKHLFKKPSKKTANWMLEGSTENRTILPLDFKGRVVCSTCHNPHQPGVMVDDRAKKGEGAVKRLRSQNICFICHSGEADQLSLEH